jgi:ABC-type lipoprotein release transport system permease subunit
MNLSTARAQKRSREIGISKTVGAKRYELINRLTFETGIFTFISFLTGFILAAMLLPVFNSLLGEQLQFSLAFTPLFLCIALLIWVATTVFAASYPAIYMSGFPPLLAIRSSISSPKSSHAIVRKVLTVGQFAVAIVLISWVLIIQIQIKFMNNKDLGYNPHNLIGLPLFSLPQGADLGALANDYRAESSVEMVSRESGVFFSGNGMMLMRNADDKIGSGLWSITVDPYFIDLMQLKLIAGRPLPEKQPGDSITQIILNRAAVEYLETTPEELIGRRVLAHINEKITEVCGVVENFNFEPLYQTVTPYCIHNGHSRAKSVILLRVKKGNLSEQLKTYEEIFKRHFPNEMFEPKFFDLELEKAYEGERRTSQVAIVFSMLAIFVACMGVFGLTAFMAEQRTKEIGIRKVLGASVMSIVSLFTNNYVKLLLISLVIAIPASWWVGDQYLQNFAYRISMGWWIFAVAGIVTILLTLLTVAGMAIKAAMKNPVEAIKSE